MYHRALKEDGVDPWPFPMPLLDSRKTLIELDRRADGNNIIGLV
jgi:hypothetical protein